MGPELQGPVPPSPPFSMPIYGSSKFIMVRHTDRHTDIENKNMKILLPGQSFCYPEHITFHHISYVYMDTYNICIGTLCISGIYVL